MSSVFHPRSLSSNASSSNGSRILTFVENPGGAPNLKAMPNGESFIMACFVGVAIFNTIEMAVHLHLSFWRRRSLYFWSLVAAITGILLCSTSQIVDIWVDKRPDLLPSIMSAVGWVPMVTGQSMVLYSRLHLLMVQSRVLRWLLVIIVVNAVILHGMGIVLTIGSTIVAMESRMIAFRDVYAVFEKAQVTLFFAQEAMLSGVYLWKARGFLERYSKKFDAEALSGTRGSATAVRGILRNLVSVNILILLLDVTIIILEFAGLYYVQLTYKTFVYSVKLKCEISILNRLVEFVKRIKRWDSESRQATATMEQEWQDTLDRTFGTTPVDPQSEVARASTSTPPKLKLMSDSELENGISGAASAPTTAVEARRWSFTLPPREKDNLS